MDEEDKCITLLCSLQDSCDNLIVEICSATQPTLKLDENDTIIEHLNFYNTLGSYITSVGTKMVEENKCITLLCSLLDPGTT